MGKVVFLKLGGSLITDKTKPFTQKPAVIRNIAQQIKKALDKDAKISLVIGNGAGSYAHYPAVLYKMRNGIKTEKQKMGFCLVQDAAARLNRIVVEQLLKAGVKCMSLNPSSMIVSKDGKIKDFFVDPVIKLLRLGITPVLYGDIVYDEKLGSQIYSTEMLLTELALRFKKLKIEVNSIIHNGITSGVMDEKGNLIPRISSDNFKTLKKIFTSTKGFDVTGGMLHKVRESLKLAKHGMKTVIINGVSQKDLLKKAILGEEVVGTVIYG